MNRKLVLVLVALAAAGGGYYVYERMPGKASVPDLAPVGATLLDGLGDYSMPVTTKIPAAQRWFDQGLALTYGFNHDAAERSYLKAAELDPDCAMCWWGAALVLGPHVNSTMDPANNAKAWDRVQRAQRAAAKATPRERAFITALAARYAANPPVDRRSLDEAYATAMGKLAAAYPDDLDAVTMHAESLMDLQPWDFWDASGQPKGHAAKIVSQLEAVIVRAPDHAGALHLYIHAVEASPAPERGVAAADRLRELLPGSGHLVHMPAHIYARVGRYHDAVIANQKAIAADDNYLAICRPGPGVYPLGYVPHNLHFLWYAATMEGNSALALSAAAATAARTSDPQLMRTPGFEAMQNYSLTPLFSDVRFGRWQQVIDTPRPPADLPYMVAMWHYAQGMAAVKQRRLDDARKHLASVSRGALDPTVIAMKAWDRYSLADGVRVAEKLLAAGLALATNDNDRAIAALMEAVAIEDSMLYDEPPAWHWPVRQSLGAALLAAGRAKEAETAYREELRRNPENGWSLHGLELALRAQGRKNEAQAVAERFVHAWEHADIKLSDS